MSQKPNTLHNQQVYCKNDCGYYGNPEWNGYCSKCHRELTQKSKPERSSTKKVQRSHSDVHDALSLGFSKFEEKKKQQSHKPAKTIKSIIRGHTMKESTSQSPSRDLFPISEVMKYCKDLSFKDAVAKDIAKQIQRQLDLMSKHFDKTIDEQSEIMQDFYNSMFNRCEVNALYADMESEVIDQLMDNIEEMLMNSLYRTVTQQISSEYEEKDLALQKRIRNFNWISAQHLGLNITESSPQVRELIDKAIADVIQMDSKIAPQQKIKCIVACSASIFSIINLCLKGAASADEFLPLMVYIVLKANPPLLQSNIKYITSYSIPARLRSGEGAYYFTNLCCAVAFIERLTGESLGMSEDEFQRYLSGEVPVSHIEQNATDCEGLRLMTQNLAALNEIQERNNQILSNMNNLNEDILKFQEILQKAKPSSPFQINPTPYIVPGNTDMSFIPEILRNRVHLNGPVEDILIDIDFKNEPDENPSAVSDENVLNTPLKISGHLSTADSLLPSIGDIPMSVESTLVDSNAPTLTPLQPLQVLLPTQNKASDDTIGLPNNSVYQDISLPQNFSQPVDIKDLHYPTELFPDSKSDESSVEFGPFESCDPVEPVPKSVMNPLSPEASYLDENIHLPPPLQPVVVQNLSKDKN